MEVWPWHLPALEAWDAVSGQWAVVAVPGGMGPGRLLWMGLDAARAQAALALAGHALALDDWNRLREIARGAAEVLNG